MDEANDDIGDLDAGVVDVVLDADLPARLEVIGAEEALEGVAENAVAEVADVRGFVGVDAGVLDEAEARAAEVAVAIGGDVEDGGGAAEAEVEVAGAGEIDGGEAGEIAGGDRGLKVGDELSGDDTRGFAEALREIEGDGCAEFTEGDRGWLLEGDGREVEGVVLGEEGAELGDEALLEGAVHGSWLLEAGRRWLSPAAFV